MTTVATTQLSSKGQVVIPEEIRERLRLRPGSRFVVVGEHGVVILKTIDPPTMEEFDGLVAKARAQAKKAGVRRGDVAAAVRRSRTRR